jgi:hypothetical protein
MKVITVVSGLARSGTSLMMQMLAAGGLPILADEIRRPDENNPLGYFEFEPVKRLRQDSSWLGSAEGKAVKVVYLLLRHLPTTYTYRIILMRRPLPEVLASQRAMLQRSGRTGADVSDDRLAEIFRRQLAQLETWLQRQPHLAVLAVEYHDCLSQPASVARAVNQFLEGGLDERAMAAVVNPSLYRQRSSTR